jgi:hypothetical protein
MIANSPAIIGFITISRFPLASSIASVTPSLQPVRISVDTSGPIAWSRSKKYGGNRGEDKPSRTGKARSKRESMKIEALKSKKNPYPRGGGLHMKKTGSRKAMSPE